MQGLKPTENKCGDFNIYIKTGRNEYILPFVIPFFTSTQDLILPEVIISVGTMLAFTWIQQS